MQKIFRSKNFYLSFILFVTIIFITVINFNRAYVSNFYVLIIPKSEKASSNSEQIIENLKFFPTTLSFYNQISKETGEDMDDSISDLPDYKKREHWNSKLKIERVGKSGILKFFISDADRYQAEILNETTLKTFIDSIGFYYDIKNDIDVRIIDKPIIKESSDKSNVLLFLLSLVLGFILTFILFLASFYLFENKKETKKIQSDIFSFKKEFRDKKKGMEDLNKIILKEEERPIDFLKKPEITLHKKSSAPDNLPVASEESEEKFEEKKSSAEPIIREATPEEVKERLNKLLSGKL